MGIGGMHLTVCRRFGMAVRSAEGRWDRQSPCTEWTARDVLEHVIGFHDVLLLRPLGCKPDRRRDDAQVRWDLTLDGLERAFSQHELFDRVVDVPAVGQNPPTQLDATALVPRLTQDVLIHTWDLARAVDADDQLDKQLCEAFLSRLPREPDALSASGMFAAPIAVDAAADAQAKLLARLGRDPAWRRRDAGSA